MKRDVPDKTRCRRRARASLDGWMNGETPDPGERKTRRRPKMQRNDLGRGVDVGKHGSVQCDGGPAVARARDRVVRCSPAFF